MSSNSNIVQLDNVWKKYSREVVFHRSLREDIMGIFQKSELKSDLLKNEFWALKNINISFNKGELIGLYGKNGSGKTTVLKLIANVTYPNIGNIHLEGNVAPLLEIGAGFHPDLTGLENIYVNGVILGLKINQIKKKLQSIIEFSEINDFINLPVKKYSSGMFLRLAFSIAIHSEAEIYLFDEIIAVGDKQFQNKCLQKLSELKNLGKTIVFVSHDKSLLDRLCDRILFLKQGCLCEDDQA